jgi:O-antigen ligase
MGFFLLILYLAVSYLSPGQIYPELAQYSIVLWIAIAAGLASVPSLLRQMTFWAAPQTKLLLGLMGAMILSEVSHLWLGGIVFALENFMPVLVVFFLICIHVDSWNRLRVLAILMAAIALFFLSRAVWDLHSGNLNSPYLMEMNWDLGPSRFSFIRIRAVGYLADPNDLAQFLIVVLPLVTLAWKQGKRIDNLLFVILPAAFIVYGVYLTHSRGAMIALVVLAVLLASRRIPLVVSTGFGALLFAGMTALGFSGGRDVSVSAGSERIDLWGLGLQMFRSSPLWGVGYGMFTNHTHLTAHNSYALCLAEVGAIGYTLWLAAVVITLLQLNSMLKVPQKSRKEEDSEVLTLAAEQALSFEMAGGDDSPTPEESEKQKNDEERVRHWAQVLRMSLLGFLVTAWFLSRTYTITLYVLLGMTVVLTGFLKDAPEESRWRRRNWIPITAAAEFATILAIYLIVRFQDLLAK